MEKYINEIENARSELRQLSIEAQKENKPVDPKFYEIQKKLCKVWKNLQAWCKRHGEQFPLEKLSMTPIDK